MDTLVIVLQIRPCDLNSLLNGKAAYKWQHACKETKARVWARLKDHILYDNDGRVPLNMNEVQRFVDLKCDDLFDMSWIRGANHDEI